MPLKITSVPLPHFNDRPAGTAIDTIIVHSMYVPKSSKPFDPKVCAARLDEVQVSAHYLIARRGGVIRLVPDAKRAWHAGVSRMPSDGRENVNDFSIGIELLGRTEDGFPPAEYRALASLSAALCKRFPIRSILGHEHVAPVRKTDPGPHFEWARYRADLKALGIATDKIAWPKIRGLSA